MDRVQQPSTTDLEPEVAFLDSDDPIDWAGEFGRDATFVVEIGSGNGVFIVDEAARHPGNDYLTVERSWEFYTKLRKRIVRHGLRNVRCMRADVFDVFEISLAPGTVSHVISNFSAPWPTRRHPGRRIVRPEFLGLLQRVLIPGGELSFRTDVSWYVNLTVTLFREAEGWSLTESGPIAIPPPEGRTQTNYERKAREAGDSVWGFQACWKGP